MTMANKPDRPRGWPLSPGTVRSVLSGHGILGLIFAAIIYLVCLTGTLVVFVHDLERWEQPGAPVVAALGQAQIARAIDTARSAASGDATLYVTLPSADEPGATMTAFKPGFDRDWAIGEKGELVARTAPFSEFLLKLHIALHLPRTWGEFLVGLTGVALLSSLVSGILAHPRILKDAFHLRLGGSRRLQEADIHNRLGIWALPFHVAIALTGALLGLSTIIVGVLALLLYRGDTAKVYSLFVEQAPVVNASTMPLPPISLLLAEASRRAPEAQPHQIIVERAGRADARITIVSTRPALLVPQDTTIFDATGTVIKDQHPRDLAAGTRILGGIGQLHFGWFGGLPVRIVYGLLGLALCLVTSSGVTIWLTRRRDRGRAVPHWERLWAGVVWGQPVAITATAICALAFPDTPADTVWIWAGSTLILLVATGLTRKASEIQLGEWLRSVLGIFLIILPIGHFTFGTYSIPASFLDFVLLITGGWFLYLAAAKRVNARMRASDMRS
jgi:uncharacterized iron-regulated membrane protein